VARTLDLHGKTTAEARRMLSDFILTTSRGASGRVVRIITGKGARSAGRAVLLPMVRYWLETDLTRYVDSMASDVDGGSYLVRLK
jgi:DNA-nicking Smr family endonuclease